MNSSTTSESISNCSSIEICVKELDALLDSKESIKEEPENVTNNSVTSLSSNESGFRRSRLMSKRTFKQKRNSISQSQASFLSTTQLSNSSSISDQNTNNFENEQNSIDIPSNQSTRKIDTIVPTWDGDNRTETGRKATLKINNATAEKTSILKKTKSKDNNRKKTQRQQEWKAKKNYVRKANSSAQQLMFPRLTFQRIVQEIMQGLQLDFRFQSLALAALQEAAEAYLSEMFSTATWATSHCKRVTLQPSDIALIKKIRRIKDN